MRAGERRMNPWKSSSASISVFPKGCLDDLVKGTLSLFEWIEMAGTLGADGLEMYDKFFETAADAASLDRVKEAASRQGLFIPMMCASPDFTHPDAAFRAQEVERMRRMIEITAYLGPEEFRSCRVLSGQNRPGLRREDGVRWTVECIEALLPFAEERRVHLAMENHYKDGFWTYPEFALPSEIYLEIIGRIDSPYFGVNYDPSNALVAGEDPLALLRQVKERIVTMHASDRYLKEGYATEDLKSYSLKGYSEALAHGVIGQGMNDYDAIFDLLRSVSFKGWISIEDGVNGLDDLRESVRFLRSKIDEYLT